MNSCLYRLLPATALLAALHLSAAPSAAADAENVFARYADYQHCWQAAEKGDAAAYEGIGDFYFHQQAFDGKKIAQVWYRKAAEHGRASARNKLHRMGITAGPEQKSPLPMCPRKRVGEGSFEGMVLEQTKDHEDVFLLEDAAGHRLEVVMENASLHELAPLRQDIDLLSLRYVTEQRLDAHTAACGPAHYYVDGSGEIREPRPGSVLPFPRVLTEDVASGGVLDEAALRTALSAWARTLNAWLASMSALTPEQVDAALSGSTPLASLYAAPVLAELYEILLPLRLQLVEEGGVHEAQAGILRLLARYALELDHGEGYVDLRVVDSRLYSRIQRLSPALRTWFDDVGYTVPDIFTASDGLCRFGLGTLGDFARRCVFFLHNAPASPYARKVGAQYRSLMEVILFGEPPFSAFMPENDFLMDEDRLALLKSLGGMYPPAPHMSSLLKEFCDAVEANGRKRLSPDREQYFRKRIQGEAASR